MDWKKTDQERLLFEWLLVKSNLQWWKYPQKTQNIAHQETWQEWVIWILWCFYVFSINDIDRLLFFCLLDELIESIYLNKTEWEYEKIDLAWARKGIREKNFLKKWYFLFNNQNDLPDLYIKLNDRKLEMWIILYLLDWKNDRLEIDNKILSKWKNYYKWDIQLEKTIDIIKEKSEVFNNNFIQVSVEHSDKSLDVLTSLIYLDFFGFIDIHSIENYRDDKMFTFKLEDKLLKMIKQKQLKFITKLWFDIDSWAIEINWSEICKLWMYTREYYFFKILYENYWQPVKYEQICEYLTEDKEWFSSIDTKLSNPISQPSYLASLKKDLPEAIKQYIQSAWKNSKAYILKV